MKNIILSGHINSGKSTVANYLVEKYNYTKFSLGDEVKLFICDLFTVLHSLNNNIPIINLADLYSRDKKEQYREYMQLIATDIIRNYFGSDIWVECLKRKIDKNMKIYYKQQNLETQNKQQNLTQNLKTTDKQQNLAQNLETTDEQNIMNQQNIKNNFPFVIDDIRFKNEYSFFKNSDSNVISIRIKGKNETQSNHISEHEIDDLKFDYEIENNGNLDDLYLKVDKIMNEIKNVDSFAEGSLKNKLN